MKTALVHDWLIGIAGGEKVSEDILNVYNGQEDIMKQWNSINTKEILEILEVNKRKIVKEVSDRYKKLREAIMKS